jgi:hypothetical protein
MGDLSVIIDIIAAAVRESSICNGATCLLHVRRQSRNVF